MFEAGTIGCRETKILRWIMCMTLDFRRARWQWGLFSNFFGFGVSQDGVSRD
jgi:hypothetical protein